MSRRSVSSWVSPGPRKPMPPFCRSRWVQPRTKRVAKCESCASSTCSLPSKLRARCAKISRYQAVTIQYSTAGEFLEIAFLARSQGLIDQHHIGIVLLRAGANFLGLARTDEVLRIRPRTRRQHQTHAQRPRRSGQRREFGAYRGDPQGARCPRRPKRRAHHPAGVQTTAEPCRLRHSTIAGSVTSPSSPVGSRTLRAGTTVEMACLYTI